MKITISEIAEMAGVSKTTVSRVINNKPDVRPETRAQISDLIQKYNFTPNALARAIFTQKSHTIGLIIPHEATDIFTNPFFVEVMQGISSEVDKSGYFLLLCYPHDNNYLDIFKQKRVDGFILLSPGENQNELVENLNAIKAPFVSTSIQADSKNIPNVDINNFQSGVIAGEHLISLGHERFGFIGKQNQASSNQRLNGLKSTLRNRKISLPDQHIILVNETSIKSGSLAMKQLLDLTSPPTAVVTVSDMLAIGAIQSIHAVGLNVPGDFSIVGFDDISLAQYNDPPLTTIRQPSYEKGVQAALILIQNLVNNAELISKELEVEIIIRNSTSHPKR